MGNEIGRFSAKSDTGKEYTIIVYEIVTYTRSSTKPDGLILSQEKYETTSGLLVKPLEHDNEFIIVDSEEIITRTSI